MAAAVAFTLGLAANNCSFPEYGASASTAGSDSGGAGGVAAAGTAGSSGGTTAGGGGTGGVNIGDAGSGGLNGGSAGDGAAGEAGAAGSGGEPCAFPAPVIYPQHCFNKTAGDGESGVDCGGAECAPCSGNQACTQASDCLSQQCASNKCVPVISLTYTPVDVAATTQSPKFKLNISYLDSVGMVLSDLTLRYYYNHKNVTEPVIGQDSQTTIDPGNAQVDISQVMLTSVHRFPPGPADSKGLITDSYLEISYDDSRTVTTGTKFVITQDLVAGGPSPLFDQNGHYSFSTATGANTALTVYRAGQRIWGVEPPMAVFPACAFSRGVNLNGAPLTVGDESLQTESEAALTFNGTTAYSNTNKLLPTADKSTTALLGTGRTMNAGESIAWAVPNGKYWAYAWLTSMSGSSDGTLSFGSQVADKFVNNLAGGTRWALIGPYSVDITGKSLQLTVEGSVHVGGVKLYEAAR